MAPPARHMSMLRAYTPADALTIGNARCGTIAIFLCLEHLASGDTRLLWVACLLMLLALVCDVLDGYVARLDSPVRAALWSSWPDLSLGAHLVGAPRIYPRQHWANYPCRKDRGPPGDSGSRAVFWRQLIE